MDELFSELLGVEFNWTQYIHDVLANLAPNVDKRGILDDMVADVTGDLYLALTSETDNGLKRAISEVNESMTLTGLQRIKVILMQAIRYRGRDLLKKGRKYSTSAVLQFSQLEGFDAAGRGVAPEPSDESDQVRNVLKRMKEVDRQTLEAFYFDDLSLIEMSNRFAAPVGTIKRRLHTARLHLREEMEAA